jgi:hypothetical protein
VWSLATAAAIELNLSVEPERASLAAAALRADFGSPLLAAPAFARLATAAALRSHRADQLSSWFDGEINDAATAKRARKAVELALERVRLAAAARNGPEIDTAVRQVNRLLFSTKWAGDGRSQPPDLTLRLSLMESELVEAGLRPASGVVILRTSYKTLPEDSLLRAEAAWHTARLGRHTSRYLQGDEDLELAIPLWRKLGMRERAATAAWWIALDASGKRARRHAEIALELVRQLGNSALTAEIEAWLAAHPDN